MKCLYLHGLDSQPMKEKDDILLSNFEDVVSPKLDYRQPAIFSFISQIVEKNNIDILVGSSFGGFMAFHLAQKYSLSAILFNPALAYYMSNPQIIEKFVPQSMKDVYLFIGEQDDVVLPKTTLDFIESSQYTAKSFHTKIIKELGHRIPVEKFGYYIRIALDTFED